ncbi:hypothetical protein [Lysinibacillus sp. G4S2]|nr:hypothetical protein [Lysinibacillus sp. G4S2]MDM5245959.1 hypothetical protein [Lysinibacillus sp. G4S2]
MRKRSVSGKCFICAKAKRQQQSAQSERKSTTRFGEEPKKRNRCCSISLFLCLPKSFYFLYHISLLRAVYLRRFTALRTFDCL